MFLKDSKNPNEIRTKASIASWATESPVSVRPGSQSRQHWVQATGLSQLTFTVFTALSRCCLQFPEMAMDISAGCLSRAKNAALTRPF